MFLSLSHAVSWVRFGALLYRFLILVPFVTFLDIRICRVCGEARARQSLGIFAGIYCTGPIINETVRYENARTVGLDLYPGYYFRKAYAL